MTFLANRCAFKEFATQWALSTCCEPGNLYRFEKNYKVVRYSSSDFYLDIRCQLGHPSMRNIHNLVFCFESHILLRVSRV